MGSPHDGANGGDFSSTARGGGAQRSPIMISGELMARIARARRGNVELVHALEALIEDLGRDITARLREDPPGDISDLAERYHDLCDIHLKVFRSLDALMSFLEAFHKELAGLSAAAAADSSSVGGTGTAVHGQGHDGDRSLNTSPLFSFLDAFDKELEDLAAAAASARSSTDPSGGDTVVDHVREEAPRPARSRI